MISISSISAADHSGADTVSILDGGADGSVIMETDSSWNNVDAIDGSVIGDAASRLDDVSSADESSAIADSESGSIDSASSSDSTLATDNSSSSTNASSTVAVNKKATKLTASSYTYKYARKTLTLKAKLVNYQGKALSGKKIMFRFNGKNYYAKTGSNGWASVKVKISSKKNYSYNATYAGSSYYEKAKNTGKLKVNLKIRIFKWGSKGNIKNNAVLYKKLVKSSLTTAIIKAAKKGTPYIEFGDGDGKTVVVVSGIHGNELSSQAASIKLINKLAKKTNIKGKIYVFPFVAPSMTAKNTRYYNGKNLNSIANQKGTIPNRIIKFAKSKNAVALGDFHCTRPGGTPGKNVAMGTYAPMASSAQLATYISKKAGVAKLIYSKAALEYPGALEDHCCINGITSVTCEVKTPHGTIASGTIGKSYTMMKYFLKYYKVFPS